MIGRDFSAQKHQRFPVMQWGRFVKYGGLNKVARELERFQPGFNRYVKQNAHLARKGKCCLIKVCFLIKD